MPAEIQRWNWGAALFTTIWAWQMGLTKNRDTMLTILHTEGYKAGGLFFYFSLGSRGNELAWKYRKWPSVADFLRTQKRWSISALALLIPMGSVALYLLVALVYALFKRWPTIL